MACFGRKKNPVDPSCSSRELSFGQCLRSLGICWWRAIFWGIPEKNQTIHKKCIKKSQVDLLSDLSNHCTCLRRAGKVRCRMVHLMSFRLKARPQLVVILNFYQLWIVPLIKRFSPLRCLSAIFFGTVAREHRNTQKYPWVCPGYACKGTKKHVCLLVLIEHWIMSVEAEGIANGVFVQPLAICDFIWMQMLVFLCVKTLIRYLDDYPT